jgi:hypothetical protein
MRVEFVDTPSLLELRASVAQRLPTSGAFEGCTAKDQRTILAQACMVIFHLTAGESGKRLYRMHLCPSADGPPARRCSTPWRACVRMLSPPCRCTLPRGARYWQGGWSPSQWEGYSEGVKGVLLEVFVTDTRQQALAACEWGTH